MLLAIRQQQRMPFSMEVIAAVLVDDRQRRAFSSLEGIARCLCVAARWAVVDFDCARTSFFSSADIFANNSTKNGFLTVQLTEAEVEELAMRAREVENYQLTVDLEQCEVRDEQGFRAKFPINDFVRHCLLNGLDDIGLTLQHDSEISAYEANIVCFSRCSRFKVNRRSNPVKICKTDASMFYLFHAAVDAGWATFSGSESAFRFVPGQSSGESALGQNKPPPRSVGRNPVVTHTSNYWRVRRRSCGIWHRDLYFGHNQDWQRAAKISAQVSAISRLTFIVPSGSHPDSFWRAAVETPPSSTHRRRLRMQYRWRSPPHSSRTCRCT